MVGRTVAHYKVVERIGSGGMGIVYKAEDLRLGRPVALKFLPPEMSSSPTAVERFQREARTASALNHPNICTIYGFDEFEGQRFLAMELLEGQPLDEVIDGKPIDDGSCSTSASRLRMPSTRRTARASCTATSSPPTSS